MKKKGILIQSLGEVFFREYTVDGEFVDYDINHCDLSITIDDDSAQVRVDKEGNPYIDHDDATLGYNTENKNGTT